MKNKKIGKTTPETVAEHPDDKFLREQSERQAEKVIQTFAVKNRRKLVALIQTYADADAQRLLEDLREQFWSSLPVEQ